MDTAENMADGEEKRRKEKKREDEEGRVNQFGERADLYGVHAPEYAGPRRQNPRGDITSSSSSSSSDTSRRITTATWPIHPFLTLRFGPRRARKKQRK